MEKREGRFAPFKCRLAHRKRGARPSTSAERVQRRVQVAVFQCGVHDSDPVLVRVEQPRVRGISVRDGPAAVFDSLPFQICQVGMQEHCCRRHRHCRRVSRKCAVRRINDK